MTKYARYCHEAMPKAGSVKAKARSMVRAAVLSMKAIMPAKPSERFLRCLYCHYLFDDQKDKFDRLIVSLKKMGQFVDTDTCAAMVKGERPVDGRYFHLSFDDGFKNNFTNAAPILAKHEVPAIIFVPSALVGADWQTARDYCRDTMNYTGVIEMMSKDDIHEMLRMPTMEIGSHTRTHAAFSRISSDEKALESEIVDSKKDLEDTYGIECKYISWPYGTRRDVDPTSLAKVREAGYQACFGAFRGTVVPGQTSVWEIPRHHFEANWPISHTRYFARGNMEK